jgi:hypothetical protein
MMKMCMQRKRALQAVSKDKRNHTKKKNNKSVAIRRDGMRYGEGLVES